MSRPIDPEPAQVQVQQEEADLSDPPNWYNDNYMGEVMWDAEGGCPSGTIGLDIPLTGTFSYFILSGVKFGVTSGAPGERAIGFSYDGPDSTTMIKDLLLPGALIVFG